MIAKRGLLSGLSSALASDNDDVQQRAAAVVMALVTGTNARELVDAFMGSELKWVAASCIQRPIT